MISLLGALFILVGFVLILKLLKLIENSKEVLSISKQAHAVIKNTAMSDDEKEVAMQSHAKRLFVLFFIITLGLTASLGVPVGILWMADQTGLLSLNDVIDLTLSWQFILGSTVILIAVVKIMRMRSK